MFRVQLVKISDAGNVENVRAGLSKNESLLSYLKALVFVFV